MEYQIRENFRGKKVVAYKCAKCLSELESPLQEAGSLQQCPFCQHGFFSPGVEEKNAEDRQSALEQIAKASAAQALQKQLQQTTPVQVRPVQAPPELVWYGAMCCHACGYQWQARRQTPPAKCAGCGSRRISAIRVPRRSGCTLSVLLFVISAAALAVFGRL